MKGLTVWVVTQYFDYENTEVDSVFADKNEAVSYIIKQLGERKWEYHNYGTYHSWHSENFGYDLTPMVIG